MSILQAIGKTPLVPLKHLAAGCKHRVLVKCEHLNPGGSVKDRLAKAIVDDAEERGVLAHGATLIEATAGNTGVGLALVAGARGYRLVCVMPEKMSQEKRTMLTMLGAQVLITKNAPPSNSENFRNVAARLADEHGYFNTDQFRSPANARIHETTTAVEIIEQTGGKLGAFVAGAGTGGTITGVGRALRRALPRVKVVLADPEGSGLAEWVRTGTPGVDGSYAVEGIGAAEPTVIMDRTVIDEALSISDAESFETTRRLIQEEGLLVGGSAGTAVAAALRLAERDDIQGDVVAILPDSWDRYTSKPWMQDWIATPRANAQ
jgi:cysteine synthase